MGTISNGELELRRVVDCVIQIEESAIHRRALEEATNDATISGAETGTFSDEKMGTISNGQSELRRVVDCLIQIEESPIHRRALEEATNDATISGARKEELLSRSENMKKNIFQVVGFYLVVQTVLIALVAQSSILRVGNLWSPLALSTVTAVSCFIPVCQNGMAIAKLRGDMHDEENIHKVAEKARTELRRLGTKYAFPASTEPKSKKRSTCVYFLPYALLLLFLICVTLLILISEWRILSSAH